MVPGVVAYAEIAAITVALAGCLTGMIVVLVHGTRPAPKRGQAELPGQTEAQLAQLQHSVDAIAVEVERIAEAQRFSAKLLVDRGDARAELSQ